MLNFSFIALEQLKIYIDLYKQCLSFLQIARTPWRQRPYLFWLSAPFHHLVWWLGHGGSSVKKKKNTCWKKKQRGNTIPTASYFQVDAHTSSEDLSDCREQKRGRCTCGVAPAGSLYLWDLPAKGEGGFEPALTRENCDCPKVVTGWTQQWFGLNYYEATYPSLTNNDIFITICLILTFTSLLFTNTEKGT